jgi:hypothetical protein
MSNWISVDDELYELIMSSLTACNFNKQQPDELVSLTDDVFKKNEGVDIQIKPIPKMKVLGTD